MNKIKLTREEANEMLARFRAPHFTNCQTYVAVCQVDAEWAKSVLPPPLEFEQPIVTFMMYESDQFTGFTCALQARYKDIVGDWGMAFVMDTDFATIYGREGLAEPKKIGVTKIVDDGKKFVGTMSRFGQELVRIEADIVGPGPEGLGSGVAHNLHYKYSIKADGSGLTPVSLIDACFNNVATNPVMMKNCTIKTVDTVNDIYGQIPIEKVLSCFSIMVDMRGSGKFLTDVDADEFFPYAFFKHDDYRPIMAVD